MEIDLHRVLDALPAMVWTAQPDGHIDFVNRHWSEYTGLATDQAHGWEWQSAIRPDDLPALLERWRSILASNEPGEMEARVRRSDGHYRWFLVQCSPMRDDSGRIVKWCGVASDVEEFRRTQEALRRRELDFQTLVDGIPGLVACFTPGGELELVNHEVLEYYGRNLSELKRWGTADIVHPEDLPRAARLFAQSIASGDPFDFEVRSRRYDGQYRWFQSRGFPLRDANGRIVRWYNLLIDIDERKRAEQALAASEHNLQLTIDTIPAVAWTARLDGSADFFNQHYLDYVGFSLAQAKGWGWTGAVHPNDLPGLVDTWRMVMAAGTTGEAEARLRRHDGEYRWFLFRANPLRDETGNIIKWYGVNTDIEDRKRAEDHLRRSEAFLAEGQRLSQTGSFSWRTDTDQIVFSDELRRIFEFTPTDVVTVPLIAARVHPMDLPLVQAKIEHARRGGTELDYGVRLQMPDGRVKHLQTFAHGVLHSDGHREIFGAMLDVTQRRLAEETLDRTRSELAHAARAMSLGALTASIAHEVNQPLSGIVTNANTCLRMLGVDPPNVDGARQTARRTIRDCNRASDVISRLRGLFSKKSMAMEPVNLNDAAREVIALLSGELQRKRVVVRTSLADELPLVSGDRVQLQQVILNLMLNASDAMGTVDNRPREIVIKTDQDDEGNARFAVADSGLGLLPGVAEKIFEPFYTTKTDGMGIGLSVSRSIIERHLGRMSATNNQGPGATFSFCIPRQSVRLTAESADGAPAAPETTEIDPPQVGPTHISASMAASSKLVRN